MKESEDFQLRVYWEIRPEMTFHIDRALELAAKSGQKPPGHSRLKMASLIAYDRVGLFAGAALYANFDFIVIDSIWVDTVRQKQGIGKILIRKIEELTLEVNCNRVITSTLTFHGSIEFWLKMGFKEYARLDNSPRGGAIIYLEKSLANNEGK